jgi:hypothetical protein
VLFGREVVDRIPALVKEWTRQHDETKFFVEQDGDREVSIEREQSIN